MAAHAWNEHRAGIALIARGHRPEHIVRVVDIDVLVDQNDVLEFRKCGKRCESGLALAAFVARGTLLELQDGEVLAAAGRVAIDVAQSPGHAVFDEPQNARLGGDADQISVLLGRADDGL